MVLLLSTIVSASPMDALRQYYEADKNEQIDTMMELTDFSHVDPADLSDFKQRTREMMETLVDIFDTKSYSISGEYVHESGDDALVFYHLKTELIDKKGKTAEIELDFVAVMHKTANKWKVVYLQPKDSFEQNMMLRALTISAGESIKEVVDEPDVGIDYDKEKKVEKEGGLWAWIKKIIYWLFGIEEAEPAPKVAPKPTQPTTPTKPIPTLSCDSGWKCKDDYTLAYKKTDCSWMSEQRCEYGCDNGACIEAPQKQTVQPMPKEPTAAPDINKGSVAHYKFEGDANDDSGNAHNAVIYGAEFVDGKFGKALSFDGVDDYVQALGTYTFSGTNQITVIAWFKLTDHKAYDGIVCSKSESCCEYRIMADPSLYPFYNPGQHSDQTVESYTFNKNTWYHYAMTVQGGGQANIYLNGELIHASSKGVPLELPDITNSFIIGMDVPLGTGSDITPNHPFNGLIDEVRIYNRALTAEEIKLIYSQ